MKKIFELDEEYEKKNLVCSVCGSTKDVRQKKIDEDKETYYCNTCCVEYIMNLKK